MSIHNHVNMYSEMLDNIKMYINNNQYSAVIQALNGLLTAKDILEDERGQMNIDDFISYIITELEQIKQIIEGNDHLSKEIKTIIDDKKHLLESHKDKSKKIKYLYDNPLEQIFYNKY